MGVRSESGKGSLSLLVWAAIAALLAAGAYLIGAGMAQRWMVPSLTLLSATVVPEQEGVAAAWLTPGNSMEGVLSAEAEDAWQFQGQAGQAATLEMWFHPGSGSSVEAEMAVQLFAPDGTVLASEVGSIFLPPYLFAPRLPATGLYRVQVAPASGAPGRYSLALTLSDASAPSAPGTTPQPQPTQAAHGTYVAAAQGKFQWPSTRREISGWVFHDPGNPGHIGLDIAAAMWDPIVAVTDGMVVYAAWGGGYGNLVIVEHDDDWLSYYAHLDEIAVEVGQTVRQGELLGGAGTTGYSTGPHLHFELRYQGRPVDPHVYLP